ncbi:hypothetical protein [Campylobacter sp. 2457A]|uniref:hypothetical protein n=1 Tax=Campylobacter sp. 2457A TaxID=2735784 RepID=UPI00301DE956|nr:hypothetical protein [Campylobacter sp. 2457A]
MLEDDFLKEKQNIRQKMLNFSRAINQGKPLDDELKNEIISSNDIFKRRLNKQPRNLFDQDEYETKNSKKSNIYLKEDLINVKLEEKQSLAKKIFSKIKEKSKNSQTQKNKKKLFSLKKTEKELQPKKIQENKIEAKNLNKKNNKESQLPKKENSHKLDKKNPKIPQTNIKQSLENLQKKIHTENISDTSLKKNPAEEDTQKAKNTLLEGFTDATKEDRNLTFNHLLFAVLLVSFALLLFVPQIYIRNQIYYLSREIATLKTEESVLNEENKDLKRRLENMRFQNQILDYLD